METKKLYELKAGRRYGLEVFYIACNGRIVHVYMSRAQAVTKFNQLIGAYP